MIYTINMLLEMNKGYSNAYNKIQRDCKSKKLIKLRRGLYEDNESTPAYLCSGYICGPSYISFDYVLSLRGLIPEYVPNITCAAFNKNKVKQYNTPIGTFIYRDIPQNVFNLAVTPMIENGYSYIIATTEKALCDKLNCMRQVYSMKDFKELLFDDLRVDKNMLRNLDWNLIKELAPRYNKKNLQYLLKLCDKEDF